MKETFKKAKRRLQIESIKNVGLLAVVICIIMTVVFMLVKSAITQKSGTKSSRINYEQYVVPKPNVKKALLTVNKNSRPGIKLRKIKGIVIHYTANPGTVRWQTEIILRAEKTYLMIRQIK